MSGDRFLTGASATLQPMAMDDQHARLLAFPGAGDAAPAWKAKALVFHDPHSQQLLTQLARIAPTRASVLIMGETGTGKELAARHIHDHSGLQGPFVAVNCAALSDSLADAELFGHEAGAYTGAVHSRVGWFEAANGGTLFLDEIGDMPLHLQQRLLRVLQERQVTRLGSRKAVPVDVRIIAATNVDLEAAVEAKQFRSDLYYRLNVAAVRVLPLRERPGDILALVNHFIEVYRRRLNLKSVGVTLAAQQLLRRYDWPGNIRELENIVHVALIMSSSGVVDVCDLRLPGAAGSSGSANSTHGREDSTAALRHALRQLLDSDRGDAYDVVERLLVATAFECCGGNQVRTAKRLGVSRNVLRAQLKRFGLLAPEEVPRHKHMEIRSEAVTAL
jgi:sigma-54-specific transcriptional regulator